MDLITLCLIGLLLIVSYYILTNTRDSREKLPLPPGPTGLPLIGCPWALKYDIEVLFDDLAKTYGDIVSVNILGKTVIGLNSAEVVREAFTSTSTADILAGRGDAPVTNEFVPDSTSFIQPGPLLAKQRKVLHKILNHYGEGLRETEATIQEELTRVMEWLEAGKQPINIDDVLYPSLTNIITILLTGKRHDYESELVRSIRYMNELSAQGASATNTMIFKLFPFMKHINFGPGRFIVSQTRICRKLVKFFFDDFKATFDPDVTRGMLDYLFRHQRDEDGSTSLSDKSIKGIIQEFLTAGIITTRGALYAFFLIIAHQPEVAKNIQKEIDTVIGEDRFPKLEDRSKMPYTTAVMLELLRYISHVPVGLPHRATEDVVIRGYLIPKDTMVFYNSWCFHHDEKTFPEPWKFNPERYLDEDRQLVQSGHISRKNLMPFGIGRRSCVGEAFAKSRMFLFMTTLLQRFNFSRDPSKLLRPSDPRSYRPAIVLSPLPYQLVISSRT